MALALDVEDYMLPAGHYLGARMIQTMERVHPRERIAACMRRLPAFLPLYNEAARRTGGCVLSDGAVAQFGALWAGAGRN